MRSKWLYPFLQSLVSTNNLIEYPQYYGNPAGGPRVSLFPFKFKPIILGLSTGDEITKKKIGQRLVKEGPG